MIVALISGIALIGWWTDHAALMAWLPGIADMTFNTALCFMLMALASCLPGERIRTSDSIRPGVGVIVGLFGALSLSQDFFGISLGIDNLLFDSHGYGLTSPHPGRMSPNTASGFLLSSIILIALTTRKQASLFTSTIIHALILLVALVSLLGIGMNVLITDVPDYFAHFASISLFTAISFLLLAITFLGIFQQRYQRENVHHILHSGIHLMYKLKYPQKFILIGLVMVMPLAILMWNKIAMLEQETEQAKLKIIGIEHVQQSNRLIKVVPEHRGMLNAHLVNPDVFSDTMQQKTEEVDLLFVALKTLDRQHIEVIRVPDEWQEITDRWAAIKANHHDPITSWRLHTEMIALLGKHLRDIGSATRLSYDEDPLIHNLVAAQLEILPRLFEQIGQLRGQGAGFMARKTISPENQLMLGSMSSRTSLLLKEAEQLTSIALSYQKNAKLEPLNRRYIKLTKAFLAIADTQLIVDKAFTISSEDYFREASRALTAGYAFSRASLQLVQRSLEQKIRDAIASQYTIKLSAMLIALLILYLFAAFYQSVMNTITALGTAAERMKTGEKDKLDTLPATDELGYVVDSFNSIAEELVRVSLHMKAVVDHTVDGILTIDPHGIIQSFNPASEHIFRYLQDEVIGQNITMLMPEELRSRHRAGLQHYLDTDEKTLIGKSIEVQGLRKDGLEFPMELSVNTMRIDEKQMFIGMVRDLTEHNEMENQLRHAQKMEAVGALVSGVAHNFNNLLAGIMGKAYLAKKKVKDRPEEALSDLESIEAISEQAGTMVKQLLTFAHKDFLQDKQDMLLAVLIKESFKTARLGIAEDIELSLNIAASDIVINCDANEIQQLLMNMMNNARDAVADTGEKRIGVSLDSHRADAGFLQQHPGLSAENKTIADEYACLTISDTGHGMDAKTMERIFDPFFTSKAVGQGTGLGLSSAFGCVASHGGVIEVDSDVGKGSTFRVYLPLIDETKAMPDDNSNLVARSLEHEMLLIVEDEPLLIEPMQEFLEDLGYEVITARDGFEGLERFKQYQDKIAVIITDVVMPRMGGVEMFRKIRLMKAAVPAIFLTGYDQGNVRLQAREKENTRLMSKPAQVVKLSRAIREVMEETLHSRKNG